MDGYKNLRLPSFAFTIVSVWTGPKYTSHNRLSKSGGSSSEYYLGLGVSVFCYNKYNTKTCYIEYISFHFIRTTTGPHSPVFCQYYALGGPLYSCLKPSTKRVDGSLGWNFSLFCDSESGTLVMEP